MNIQKNTIYVFLFFFITLVNQDLFAEIRLPKLVGDSMVIQRDTRLKIWGWADRDEKIKVKFKGKSYSTVADANGKWFVWLAPAKAGGPYSMDIAGKDEKIVIHDILVGDVWLCAGQSNMVHNLDLHSERYADEIANANYPEIRQFLVPVNPVLTGAAETLPEGNWKAANPKNVRSFSVVAYFFAKKLYDKYGVPIGFINSSVGGTPIEAWTSEEGLKDFAALQRTISQNKDTAYVNSINRKAWQKRQEMERQRPKDAGLISSVPWYDPSFQPENWQTINIPGYWEDQGIRDLNGVVWYRREINVPSAMAGKPGKIAMGRIVDADYVYINGKLVGNKTYQYPQRRYEVPAGVLNEGKNIVTVRVLNYSGKGGFVPDKPYYIAAGGDTIDLKGYWQYKVGAVYPPQRGFAGGIAAQNQPAALYNGMIAPFTDYAIKGIVWYQGESNTWNAEEYGKLLPALIHDWRMKWKKDDLPFLYVQLPNFLDADYLPSESSWAVLRESQRKTLSVPNTAMVVAIDLGEWNDIHPDNKKPVGDRLALAAEKIAYHENDVVYSGPIYSSFTRHGNKVTLHFDHVGGGLIANDGEELKRFSIAGEDKKFIWANAKIEGNDVVVWSDDIQFPAYVRYAWADNPYGANLYNKEGLPASPFEAQLVDVNKLWHGKKAAVVLTYDDALEVHLDNVIPVLDSLGFKGTFYLSVAAQGSRNRINDWKRVAKEGHELGNHTLYHPCDGGKPGRSWVTANNDLSKYTTSEIVREIEMTNAFLESLDGKKKRTFAYTCGDTETGEGSFIDAIKDKFVAMRGVNPDLNKVGSMDLTNLNCYPIDNSNADQLISWAKKAKEENALMVVLFHGVGGGHSINVDLEKHNAFLKYLKEHQDEYWVTTLLDATENYIETK